ncbi:hypothetical protein BDB01DRAFT_903759 [Pilobolus umbonatus]|nr:hypothetical protein BDB01DRAFT_903759 [Pilobolus umbonatus]
MRTFQLQHLSFLHAKNNKVQSQWLPAFLLRLMGYSSLAAAIISIIVYWYKKHISCQPQYRIIEDVPKLVEQRQYMKMAIEDTLCINKRNMQLKTLSSLKRSNSSRGSLCDMSRERVMYTPPPSPLSNRRSTSPTTNSLSNRSWSTILIDGVINATRKKKTMTISIKNTVLWNPSRDVNTPNHAFHENSVFLLNKLSENYDIHIIVHMNTPQERAQIYALLDNANLLLSDPKLAVLDEERVHYCSSEDEKTQLIEAINPSIHIEGGWELENGKNTIQTLLQKKSVETVIWIIPNNSPDRTTFNENIGLNLELVEHIFSSSVAKQYFQPYSIDNDGWY